MRFAKTSAVVLAVLLAAPPMLAANKPHTGECKKLTRQIARYQRDAHWADQPHERSRGNAPHRDELSPDGRSPYLEYQGYYKRKPGDIAE